MINGCWLTLCFPVITLFQLFCIFVVQNVSKIAHPLKMIYAFTKIIENLAANPFLLKTTEQFCMKVQKSKTNRIALSWASCVVFVLPIFAFASLHLELKPRNIICHELRNNFLFENDLSPYILINSSNINIIEDLNYFEDKKYSRMKLFLSGFPYILNIHEKNSFANPFITRYGFLLSMDLAGN